MADVLQRLTRWAAGRSDVVGLLLVGSCARGDAGPDSDVDLILLTTSGAGYVDDRWAGELEVGESLRVRSWGTVTEHRFVIGSGRELEINIGSPDWARTTPVDPGTRRVIADGARVLHDPHGLLVALLTACGR